VFFSRIQEAIIKLFDAFRVSAKEIKKQSSSSVSLPKSMDGLLGFGSFKFETARGISLIDSMNFDLPELIYPDV